MTQIWASKQKYPVVSTVEMSYLGKVEMSGRAAAVRFCSSIGRMLQIILFRPSSGCGNAVKVKPFPYFHRVPWQEDNHFCRRCDRMQRILAELEGRKNVATSGPADPGHAYLDGACAALLRRAALHTPVLSPDLNIPCMVLSFTRPEYWVPPAVKLI